METKIRENIDQPEVLEKLYRSDKKGFEKSFWSMLPTLAGNPVADFWKARLAASKKESVVDWKADLLFLILACFATGLLIQIPKLFHLNLPDDTFYMRNAVLIVFFGLSAYSLLTGKQAQTVQ